MGSIPRDHDERVRFDAFCKAVLRNEARNHMRDLRRQRRHETSLDAVPQAEMDSSPRRTTTPATALCFPRMGMTC